MPEWEALSIFLTFLIPKLPAPQEEDLSRGILEAIDMDSYRVEKQAVAYFKAHPQVEAVFTKRQISRIPGRFPYSRSPAR